MDVECEDQDGLVEKKEDSLRIEENDKSDDGKEEIVSPSNDNIVQKDKVYSGKNNVDINVSLQNVTSKTEKVSENIRNTDQVCENGKRKLKEEKPPTKVVVRRLPPLMTKEIFLEQVSPLPPYDYMYFVNGDPSYGLNSFSRAYLNFVSQEDVFTFTRTFDNYVFVDTKGQEYPAIVEFSPFQRVPKHRSKKKDALTGTIESDSMYITFKENLLAEALENSKPGAKTVKQHYFETEISTAEEINTTPLLEYLKQRRAEKARIRDERREEKKRKETERKMKQKTKDKKIDGEDEDAPKDVKIQHCTVSAEKSLSKGESLLLKLENEKVNACDKREIRLSIKESTAINKDKVSFKKKKEINVNLNQYTMNMLENNNYLKSCGKSSKNETSNEIHNEQITDSSKKIENEHKKMAVSDMKSNSTQIKNPTTMLCGLKKAEQQTQYLRKILGLSNEENHSTLVEDDLNMVQKETNISLTDNISVGTHPIESTENSNKLETKIFVSSNKTLCCEHNINPALPSASFKSSSNLLNNRKNEINTTKTTAKNATMFNENLTMKSGEINIEYSQVNRPFRDEIVIDKALSTNNVLPSAFRKTSISKNQN